MNYSEIRDLVNLYGIEDIKLEIVSCVNSSCRELSTIDFELVCKYVFKVWERLDITYIQLVSDIVCDMYASLGYGFRDDEDDRFLTKEDLVDFRNIELVISIFNDRYYY